MKKFNKEFVYAGYRFNISVELNTRAERRPGGAKWHTIITNCLGANNYYLKEEILSSDIETAIRNHEWLATQYVNKIQMSGQLSPEERVLSDLGFSSEV